MRLFWFGYWPLALLLSAYMVVCALDYGDPVAYSEQTVRTPAVHQGEMLKVFYRFRRIRMCELDRVRIVIDGRGGWHEVGRDVMPATGRANPEKNDDLEVRIPITEEFEPGPALYRPILSYQCPLVLGPFVLPNLLQEVTPLRMVLEDRPFTILPREPDKPPPG